MLRHIIFASLFLTLTACAGYQKGSDVGLGLDALSTESKEEKADAAWFKHFLTGSDGDAASE